MAPSRTTAELFRATVVPDPDGGASGPHGGGPEPDGGGLVPHGGAPEPDGGALDPHGG
ncbi:hypothetical protein HMPREF1486_02349, partial [Streptomyces sp. HPH0547]